MEKETKVKNYRLCEKFLPEHYEFPVLDKPEGWDEDIVETAGFIPLEVRFKQMEQAGIRAQFLQSEFTSFDVRDMYLNHPEFDLNGDEDMEEALQKIQLRNAWIEHVKAEKAKMKELEAQREVKANESAAKNEPKKTASEEEVKNA